jgi:NAD(P)H-hydrate epimerase
MIVDADGLNLLSLNPLQRDNWILTPHPAEAARLMSHTKIKIIQANRQQSVRMLQENYGGVVILKGAGTLVATDKHVFFNDVSNP